MNNPALLPNQKELIYVGDPMCSWCWGIAPALAELQAAWEGKFPFRVVVGGLRPHTEEPMDAGMKDFLRHHWEEVNQRSGQPFNYDLLDGDAEFVYDTEPPCRAVVAVRRLAPGQEFEFFKRVQNAFYAENRNTNAVETYVPLLEGLGISAEGFREMFASETARKETWEDFAWAKQVGVRGFPTMLFWTGDQLYALATGFSTFERMNGIVEKLLAEAAGENAH